MGDTNMCTNNQVLIKNTENKPTIMCIQRKAHKKVPTEDDIIAANKLAFNDDIGTITNYVTSMFDVQARFDKDSDEYKTLEYRIMCGELFQQNTIDRAKGIVAKPMPEYWYNPHKCVLDNGEPDYDNLKIVANNKPYFMTYIYPPLRKKYTTYIKNNKFGVVSRYGLKGIRSIQDLYDYKDKTTDMESFLDNYEKYMPVGNHPCLVNRLCWIFENEFNNYLTKKHNENPFDYTIMKSNVGYSKTVFKKIKEIFYKYEREIKSYKKSEIIEKDCDYSITEKLHMFAEKFKVECEMVCTNEDELCDIVLDLCYTTSKTKQFAWDVCGDIILKNLLKNNNNIINIPTLIKKSDIIDYEKDEIFTYAGNTYKMNQIKIDWGKNN